MNELIILAILSFAFGAGILLTQFCLWCCYRHFGGKLGYAEWSRRI